MVMHYTPLLQRTELLQRMRARPLARLAVLHAPAGFGKSVLLHQLSQSLQDEGALVVQLSIEPADNDVSRFLSRLQSRLDSHGATPEALLQRIAGEEGPFALLLDDAEHLQDAGVLAFLRELLERLPAEGQLVLAGRGRPDLGLGRLRVRGELLELSLDALRFTRAEAEAYLSAQPSLDLPTDGAEQLYRKTEGWAAGLAMAVGVLQRLPAGNGFMRQLCASDQALAAYLREAVLDQLDFETQQLLLRASLLRRLEPELCERLLPGCNARRILQDLAGEGFLVTSVESSAGTTSRRMHGLFAEVLRHRLERTQPDLALRLHLSASGWYEGRGQIDAAIEHAIAGGDLPHAAALLCAHAEGFIAQGRMRALSRWLQALPSHAVEAEPSLRVAALWSETFERGPHRPWQRLNALLPGANAWEQAHLAALQPLLLSMLDRYEDATHLLQPDIIANAHAVSPFAAVVGSNALAHIWSVAPSTTPAHAPAPQQALALLDRARGLLTEPDQRFAQSYTEAVEGLIDLHEGRLREAGARLRMAAGGRSGNSGAQAASAFYNHAHGNVWAGVLYAACVYEGGNLTQARALLRAAKPLVRELGLPDHLILTYGMEVRIAFHQGEIDVALALLAELESLGHQRQLTRVVATARLEIAWLRLHQGRALAAREAIAQADIDGVWQRVQQLRLTAHANEDPFIAKARWSLAFEDVPAAQALLAPLQTEWAQAMKSGRGRRALKLQLLQAIARQRAGDWATALIEMRTLLDRLARDGYQRIVLDEGSALVAPLLSRMQAELPNEPQRDPLIADYLARLMQSLAATQPAVAAPPIQDLLLTRQELRVLQLLAEGYSNGAMAEKLQLSDSTVRTHLRAINLKLGAHSRGQAVAAARRLAVIR